MYKERKTAKTIANSLGCTATQVEHGVRQLRQRGILNDRKQMPREHAFTAADLEILQNARRQGKSYRECVSLFPNQTAATLTQRMWNSRTNTPSVPSASVAWSAEDTRKIIFLREERRLQWNQIAELMGPRSASSIQCRYDRSTDRQSRPKVPKRNAWSDAATDELRSRIEGGERCKDIALSMGRTEKTIASKAYDLKLRDTLDKGVRPAYALWSPAETARLLDMRSNGSTMFQIAKVLGRPLRSVYGKWNVVRQDDAAGKTREGGEVRHGDV